MSISIPRTTDPAPVHHMQLTVICTHNAIVAPSGSSDLYLPSSAFGFVTGNLWMSPNAPDYVRTDSLFTSPEQRRN